MLKANKTVILYVVILSAVLAIPALTIPLVDHDARGEWENRPLTKRPKPAEVLANPKQGFAQLDDYVDDHIGGGFQVIKARRKFYFDVFNAKGDTYIVGNNDGALFLTAPFQQADRKNPFQWWTSLCVTGQNSRYQQANVKQFARTQQFLSQRGAQVVFGMVPTKPVLIQDQFPNSTPASVRKACSEITATNNLQVAINNIDPNIEIFYPYEAFKSRVSDPLFFPNTAYHWQGESSWIFAEELAAKYNLDISEKWDSGPCKPTDVEWDIGGLIGVGKETPGCDRDQSQLGIIVDDTFAYPLPDGAAKKSVTVVKMTNPHSTNQKTAIVFSNSFGPVVREKVASHFKTTYHLRVGTISDPDMRALLDTTDILNVDNIFVTVADFHYPRFLSLIGPSREVLAEEKRLEKAAALAAKQKKEEEKQKLRAEKAAKKAAAIEKRRLANEKKQAARRKKLARENERNK